jgi:hypothetical protein
MARESGGGGALAWTLLGFLAGVAATLGIQLLMNGPTRTSHEEAVSSAAPHVAVAASSAPEVKKPVAAVSSAAPTTKRAQPDAEVADDAAAAGMTSRTNAAPANPDPDVPPDHAAATPSN